MRDASITAVGRVLLAGLFLSAGLSKLGTAEATIAYIASAGLPLPTLAYAITLVVEIGAGALLMFGFHARLAAAVLAFFVVAAAVFFHNDFADENQMVHFFKNLAITGGLLQIVVSGAGQFSLDARFRTPGHI